MLIIKRPKHDFLIYIVKLVRVNIKIYVQIDVFARFFTTNQAPI